MSNRILLRLNTGAPDGSLFAQGLKNSFFKPGQWQVISDKIRDMKLQSVTSDLRFGGSYSFEYDKVGTLMEDVKLDVTLGPLTGSGTGSYARYCDYLGIALLSSVQLTYQQNTIQTKQSLAYYMNNLRDNDITHRQIFDTQLAGGLSAAERNTRATAPQKVRIYLKPYWYMLTSHCPIITALANRLKMTVNIANLQDVVQTNYSGNATADIQKLEWRYDVINTTGLERDQFAKLTFLPQGLTYLMEQVSVIPYKAIESGSTSATIKLEGLTLPWFAIYAIFQPYYDVATPYEKRLFELDPDDLNLISTVALKDGDNATFMKFYGVEDIADHFQKYHCKAQWRQPVICFSASEIADLKNVNTGSFDASNINNFLCHLEFTEALPEKYSISFVVFQHNWVNHQGGEVQTVFN